MTRRWWMTVVLVLATSACGDDKKGKDVSTAKPEPDAGKTPEPDGGESNGGTTGETGGRKWVLDKDAPNCADDDLTTPGSECASIVSCGGTAAEPYACPLETHTCCGFDVPSAKSVHCYEGTGRGCPERGIPAPCDGPEDCENGDICCVTPPGEMLPKTLCRALAECDEVSEGTVFCHTDADCPAGKSCAPTDKAPFWAFCG